MLFGLEVIEYSSGRLFRKAHTQVFAAGHRLTRQHPAVVEFLGVEGIISQHVDTAALNGAHAGGAGADKA